MSPGVRREKLEAVGKPLVQGGLERVVVRVPDVCDLVDRPVSIRIHKEILREHTPIAKAVARGVWHAIRSDVRKGSRDVQWRTHTQVMRHRSDIAQGHLHRVRELSLYGEIKILSHGI